MSHLDFFIMVPHGTMSLQSCLNLECVYIHHNLVLEFSLSFPQLYVSPSLAAFVLMVVPPIACLAVIFGRFLRSISRRTQDALAEATQVRGPVSF